MPSGGTATGGGRTGGTDTGGRFTGGTFTGGSEAGGRLTGGIFNGGRLTCGARADAGAAASTGAVGALEALLAVLSGAAGCTVVGTSTTWGGGARVWASARTVASGRASRRTASMISGLSGSIVVGGSTP